MPLWRMNDTASNSAIFGVGWFKKKISRTNANVFYSNTTASAYKGGKNMTVSEIAVTANTARALRAAHVARAPATGWVIKKVGTGGRANRTQYETIVAGRLKGPSVSAPNYGLVFLTPPANVSINAASAANVANFTVTANSVPTGATLSYYWQYQVNATAYSNVTANATYANVTGSILVVNSNNAANATVLRAVIASANNVAANNVVSGTAVLIKT